MGKNLEVHKNYVIYPILFIIGFGSAQRFSIPFYHIFPILLASTILFFNFRKIQKDKLSALAVLAAFFIVDNGITYQETHFILRYGTYFLLLYILLGQLENFNSQKIILFLGFALFLCLNTIFNILNDNNGFSEKIFVDNVKFLIIIFIIFCSTSNVNIDLKWVVAGCLGLLASELVNIAFFYRDFEHYLSYDSLKCLIVLPAAYLSFNTNRKKLQVIVWVATVYVLIFYGSRAIPVSVVASLAIIALATFKLKPLMITTSFIFILILVLQAEFTRDLLMSSSLIKFKPFAILAVLSLYLNLESLLSLEIFWILDPVRTAEHIMFFDRGFFEILLGNGLGASLFDKNGVLDFANGHASAFSQYEIKNSEYFNFHDIWIDFSVRFGLLTFFGLAFLLIQDFRDKKDKLRTFLILLLGWNATFSTAGLLVLALIFKYNKTPRYEYH